MSAWSDEFADALLGLVSPRASFRRWAALENRRGWRGVLRRLRPGCAYTSGFEIGLRGGLSALDEVRSFAAIAAATGTAETGETQAQCEAAQSGAESASPKGDA